MSNKKRDDPDWVMDAISGFIFIFQLQIPWTETRICSQNQFLECLLRFQVVGDTVGERTLKQPAEPFGRGRKVSCNCRSFDLLPYSRINYSPRSLKGRGWGTRNNMAITHLGEGTAVPAPTPGSLN